MTNWWVLSAVLTELVGAALIARGLSLEKPAQWVKGREPAAGPSSPTRI